jgi:hypothetical protein
MGRRAADDCESAPERARECEGCNHVGPDVRPAPDVGNKLLCNQCWFHTPPCTPRGRSS